VNDDKPVVGGGVAADLLSPDRPELALDLAGPAEAAAALNNFTDKGGRIIRNVQVVLVFWGTAWTAIPTPNPSAGNIADAVGIMASGQYMDSLRQYRGVGRGSLIQTVYVTQAVGNSPANPPNPFNDTDVGDLVNELCTAGRVPSPAQNDQLFFCVIMPQGVASSNANFIGEHTFSTIAGVRAHWAWVLNFGTLGSITNILSHELVETCTDPEGDGWTGNVCSQSGWCEIGDVCNTSAVVDGVTVQRYWSNFDGQCVVPTDAVVKTDKDDKDSKDRKDKDKDTKDRKDRKEVKDGKEKDKDAKEKDQDATDIGPMLERVVSRLEELSNRIAALEARGGSASSFIEPDERPEVGGGVTRPDPS
jgi:hypothetical protein